MIELLISNSWLIASLGTIVGFIASYLAGKQTGKTNERMKRQELEIEIMNKEIEYINRIDRAVSDVKKDIGIIDDVGLAQRLRDEWSRD